MVAIVWDVPRIERPVYSHIGTIEEGRFKPIVGEDIYLDCMNAIRLLPRKIREFHGKLTDPLGLFNTTTALAAFRAAQKRDGNNIYLAGANDPWIAPVRLDSTFGVIYEPTAWVVLRERF